MNLTVAAIILVFSRVAQSIAHLAGVVVGVALALDGFCICWEIRPPATAAVRTLVPYLAGVAVGFGVVGVVLGTYSCGRGAAGCPDGGPGLGGKVGGGPTEEKKGKPIEESIRAQRHGLSPEFAKGSGDCGSGKWGPDYQKMKLTPSRSDFIELIHIFVSFQPAHVILQYPLGLWWQVGFPLLQL